MFLRPFKSVYIKQNTKPLENYLKSCFMKQNLNICNFKIKYIHINKKLTPTLLKSRILSPKHVQYPKELHRKNNDRVTCWKCESPNIEFNICQNCGFIQPLSKNLDYFQILNIEKSFTINKRDLVKLYRKMQSKYHPDKFSVKTEEERKIAEEHSSAVNKAYNTLLNPISRGEYMLAQAGQALSEGEINMDAEFLSEIMEINEELAEADNAETVKQISDKNREIMDQLTREAEESFGADDIEGAKAIVAKLKYYKNIYEKVKEFETKHGIFYE